MKIKQVNGVFFIEPETEMGFTFLNECAYQQYGVEVHIAPFTQPVPVTPPEVERATSHA